MKNIRKTAAKGSRWVGGRDRGPGQEISCGWPVACNRNETEGETPEAALFALDFINRKTSTQVSVSLGPAGGSFDGDDWTTERLSPGAEEKKLGVWPETTQEARKKTLGPDQTRRWKMKNRQPKPRNKAKEKKFPKTKFKSKSNFIHIMNTPST